MSSANCDKHACFANLQSAEAVDDRNAMNRKVLMQSLGDSFHFGKRHRLIGLIVQIERSAAMGFVAHEAIKGDHGAILRGAHVAHDSVPVDG